MKNILKLIIVFVFGVLVSSTLSTYTYIKIRPQRQVKYEDKKELKSTSDPDYIKNVYSSSNTIGSNISELKKHGCFTYTGTTNSSGVLTVTHNKNISGSYYPVASPANNTNALWIYRTYDVKANYFKLSLARIDSFVLANPGAVSIKVYWCY